MLSEGQAHHEQTEQQAEWPMVVLCWVLLFPGSGAVDWLHRTGVWLAPGGRAGAAQEAQVAVTHGTARPSSHRLHASNSNKTANRPRLGHALSQCPAKLPFRSRPHTPQPTAWFPSASAVGTATAPAVL